MMKRCFYIANAYDGAYFILTDNLKEYAASMGSYVLNLEGSSKTNHYTFGSVEMSAIEYDRYREEAKRLESSLVEQKKQEREIAASEVPTQETSDEDKETPEDGPTLPKKGKISKGHLRLV